MRVSGNSERDLRPEERGCSRWSTAFRRLPTPGGLPNPLSFYVGQLPECCESDPPEGITIEDVLSVEAGAVILFRADADKVEPGLKGNLIVDAFIQRALPRQDGKPGNKRRFPVGTLPAIPFEIVPFRTGNRSDLTSPVQ